MSAANSDLPPLYTQNPRDRFSNRAEDYSRYRPTYPTEAIDWTLDGLSDPATLTIADIGAGTGISSRLLGDRGATVWAIEPNETMRSAAEPHPRVEFRSGTAEATGLDANCVDLITCCQSFHWFEPIATLQEFHRILRSGGRVALMWNERDQADPFTAEHTAVIRKAAATDFFDHPSRKSADPLSESDRFTDYRKQSFPNQQPLSLDAMIGLALSASYIPKSGAVYEQLLVDLRDLFDRWNQNSIVTLVYQTNVYLAEAITQS
ncbi:class I SAM-dependent methyltransferase [Microcoleus sp. FACHB-1515]|uniref:class I SAM-dependent methyltransferase n=1 Tax=Cyanophyceae TaxID=3028117 RepID=UPI0016891F5C|nr:class I SAM-dependent methyltransferase [Microcoleus sp. FACHB-1515]MBD2088395.1 class I SAM-dependent methyltransferase [Microcoleus sp. FACHB-1515]